MAKETNAKKKENTGNVKKTETVKKETKKTTTPKTTSKKSVSKGENKETVKKVTTKKEPNKTVKKETTDKGTSKTTQTKKKTSSEKVKKEVIVESQPKKENTEVSKSPKKKASEKHPETKNVSTSKSDEVTKLVEIILVILVIFAAFYLITYWVDHSKKKTTNNKTENTQDTVIQYDEILVGNILNQNKSEYYVLVMTEKDKTEKTFSTYTTNYTAKEGSLRLYTANLDDIFNKTYKGEESKLDSENIDDLKVKENTLLKIADHKIVESIEGTSNIQKKLTELAQ